MAPLTRWSIDFILRSVIMFIWWTTVDADTQSATGTVDVPPKLLLISLDGLRHDFISATRTPSLHWLATEGVWLERGIKVQVHTVTASNHYSIATGLYQESHGIIDNEFFDPVLNETYDLWNFDENQTQYERSKLPFWYAGTTPLWQTNEDEKYAHQSDRKNRRRSASLYWPMADAWINNRTIFRNRTWAEYGDLIVWRKEIDTLIEWLTNDTEPANFVLYYVAQPDGVQHHNDLYSTTVHNTITDLDTVIGYLIDRMKATGLWDKLNIIVTADHGHANIPDMDHWIPMWDYVDYDRVFTNGPSILPKPWSDATADEIYQNLTNAKLQHQLPIDLWRKEDFPTHYHYTNNSRIGPILVFPHLGYYLLYYGSKKELQEKHGSTFATHGFLNDYTDMRPLFVAHGPAFRRNFRVFGHDEVENVDIYPLMCEILGLEPLANNGSMQRIRFILANDKTNVQQSESGRSWFTDASFIPTSFTESQLLLLCIVPAVLLVLLVIFFLLDVCGGRCFRSSDGFAYRRIATANADSHSQRNSRQQRSSADAVIPMDGEFSRYNSRTGRQNRRPGDKKQLLNLTDDLQMSSEENEL